MEEKMEEEKIENNTYLKKGEIQFVWIIITLIVSSALAFLGTQYVYNQKITSISTDFENDIRLLISEKVNLQTTINEKEAVLTKKESQITTNKKEIESIKTFFGRYISASNNYALATSTSASAYYWYDQASTAYDDVDVPWQYVIDYCLEAREYYSLAAGDYDNAEAMFKKAKDIAPAGDWTGLMEKHIALMDSGSKIQWHMYEACEYLETAALKYSQWDIYDDASFGIAGDGCIDTMNEKIAAHDTEIPIFNKNLADINALLETMGD